MKIKELKSMIENNYLDDDAEIMFSGVRNGVKHHGYEVWSTEDSLGRESMHISIATEGDNDYAVVERDVQVELWLKKADQLLIDIRTERGKNRDKVHTKEKELNDLEEEIEFEIPKTLAPRRNNQILNQLPLNPVWPVINTFLLLKVSWKNKLSLSI